MKGFLLLTLLLMPAHAGAAWSAKYAVDCPEPCDSNACKSTLRCKRTVLDDCGCCRVCAAVLGETCYRTVSGMDGVKCGPGLKCQFYTRRMTLVMNLVSAKVTTFTLHAPTAVI